MAERAGSGPSRRAVLVAGVAGIGALAAAGAGVLTGVLPRRPDEGGETPTSEIPKVSEGRVRLETVRSEARNRDVGLFTAVPEGHGDGAGLPVCLILHGGSATTADYSRFGFGRFLTAAVTSGVPPFVLAGADGGRNYWRPKPGDDAQRMLVEEMPRWLVDRGFDGCRLAAYGWSMGGYGALLLAETHPGLLRAVAALSPAVSRTGDVVGFAAKLDGRKIALWCGLDDELLPANRELARRIPGGPAVASYAPGGHTRKYWNRVTPDAFRFVGSALGP